MHWRRCSFIVSQSHGLPSVATEVLALVLLPFGIVLNLSVLLQ